MVSKASTRMSGQDWREFVAQHPGASISELARLAGKTPAAVGWANAKWDLGLGNARQYPRALMDRVADLIEQGYSQDEIAEIDGIEPRKVRRVREQLVKRGELRLPSWETLYALGRDASKARSMRGDAAGEAQRWAKENGVSWPQRDMKPPENDRLITFPKPSFKGLGPAINVTCFCADLKLTERAWGEYARAENAAMRARMGR